VSVPEQSVAGFQSVQPLACFVHVWTCAPLQRVSFRVQALVHLQVPLWQVCVPGQFAGAPHAVHPLLCTVQVSTWTPLQTVAPAVHGLLHAHAVPVQVWPAPQL
jgi:hypothetical protein